jgi:hypothetical protein
LGVSHFAHNGLYVLQLATSSARSLQLNLQALHLVVSTVL